MDIINSISKIIRYSTLLIAIIYLVYIVLIKYVGVIDFSVAYYLISEYSDFMFRGNEGELFYKGFVYLVIGLIFWIKEKKYLCSLLILLAIYYTMTRGFYVITFLCILGYYITLRRFTISTIIFVLFFCSISLLIVNGLGLFDMGENRADGDVIRIMTMQQVFERITPFSFVLGHGFGYGVPIRMVHMENSFLEIFHKQGVLGLFLWGYLLHKIIAFYKRTPSNYKGVSSVYMIGTIGVYVQSLFNPYLINPIGMSFVLLSFVVCNKLSKINESPVCSRSLSTKIA